MSNYYYDGTIEIEKDEEYVEVEVHAKGSGFSTEGDAFGYGCEPPDGDFQIDEVEYKSAKTYDEEGNMLDVEITDEIKNLVMSELYKVEFEEHVIEPDYEDYYEL